MKDLTRRKLSRIVAASDLSDGSDDALRAAAAIAERSSGELHVVHCVAQPVFPYADGNLGGAREEWLESARVDLQWQVRRVLGDSARPEVEVRVGEPAREVGEYATDSGADLLVVGPHEPRAAFDDLLGTTADRLIRTVSLPCLVANRPLQAPLRQVLFPVDFSGPSRHAVQVGFELLGEPLFAGPDDDVSTVVEMLFVSAFGAPHLRPRSVQPALTQQAEAARSRLPARARTKIYPRILSAPFAVDGIRMSAERMEPDLIVLGTHGYGTLGRALLGSVASAVARTVPFPLLLVPPP